MDVADEVSAVFPLIVPTDQKFTTYEGFVTVQDGGLYGGSLWLRLSGVEPNTQDCHKATLQLSTELSTLLQGYESLLYLRMNDCPHVAAFFIELRDILECAVANRPPPDIPRASFYSDLVSEIDAIGWNNLLDMDNGMQKLTLQLQDSHGRQHELQVQLPPNYPAAAPVVSCDLPRQLDIKWQSGSSLSSVMKQCRQSVEAFQDLWCCLEDIDAQCVVREGAQKSRSCCSRTIVVGKHVTMQLTLDMDQPRVVPEWKLMGADMQLAQYKNMMYNNLHLWDNNRLPRENLEVVLQSSLPSPSSFDALQEDMEEACAICYTHMLEDCAPSVQCGNPQCSKLFHTACLCMWLRSQVDTRHVFNMMFGKCFICKQHISVQLEGQAK